MAPLLVEQSLGAQAQQLWHTGLVALRHVGSSLTRDRTHFPWIGRQILNHWTTREAPRLYLDNIFIHVLPPGTSPVKRSPSTSLYQRRNLTHSPQTPSLVLCLPLGSVASTQQLKSKPEWHLYSFSACLPWSNVSKVHWPWLLYFLSIYFSILPRLQFAHSKLWSGLRSRADKPSCLHVTSLQGIL